MRSEFTHQLGTSIIDEVEGVPFAYFQCGICKDLFPKCNVRIVPLPGAVRNTAFLMACYQCAKDQNVESAPVDISIPTEFAFADLSRVAVQAKEKQKLNKFVNKAYKDVILNLCILGPAQSGKTYVIWALARALARQGVTATVHDGVYLHGAWKNGWVDGGAKQNQLVEKLTNTPVLLLDQFTYGLVEGGQTSPWGAVMGNIIEKRISYHRRTVIALPFTEAALGFEIPLKVPKAVESRFPSFAQVPLTLDGTNKARAELASKQIAEVDGGI